MAQETLNATTQQIKLKSGLRADLEKTATARLGVQGELAHATDTKQLFVHDGTSFVPIQSLDMAVTDEGNVVTSDGQIVYNY